MLLTVEQRPPALVSNDQQEKERKILADLAALETRGASELCLNYRRLESIPVTLVGSTYCQSRLLKLYLKGNIINQMVKIKTSYPHFSVSVNAMFSLPSCGY